MTPNIYQALYYAIYSLFRTLVPEPHNRLPFTLSTAPLVLLSFCPYLFLGYLSRRKDTYLIRVLLLPSVICSLLSWPFRYTWMTAQLSVYNWGQTLLVGALIAKALEFAFTKEGMLKVGQRELEEIAPSPAVNEDEGEESDDENDKQKVLTSNGHSDRKGHKYIDQKSILPHWLYDAFEVAISVRGIGFKHGLETHIPPPDRPLTRHAFLKATLRAFLLNFLIVDFLETVLKLVPGVGSVEGGSIFFPQLLPPLRYIVSTAIHMSVGMALLAGFRMVYDLIALIAVFFGSLPSSWPPVMDHPWGADSMHKLWARCWHQLLRQAFVTFGGYPGKMIAGNLGMLLGTFMASGLYHELTMYAMGRGLEWTPFLFFSSQALFLIAERVWRKVMGRRVGGVWGRLWVYFDMFVVAQPMVDSWLRRGLGGALVIPPVFSPARWIAAYLEYRITSN